MAHISTDPNLRSIFFNEPGLRERSDKLFQMICNMNMFEHVSGTVILKLSEYIFWQEGLFDLIIMHNILYQHNNRIKTEMVLR